MGTRHLIAVQLNNEYKVAQYGQWDGYPAGQGVTILDFLSKCDLDKFKEQVAKTKFISLEKLKRYWNDCGADPENDWVTMDVSDRFNQIHPQLSRNCGAKLLDIIYQNNDVELFGNIDFAGDSLYCEYAYVIDLDKMKLEVFKGFNKTPLDENERFFNAPIDKEQSHRETQYYQVKFKHAFDLSALPSKEEFLKILEPDDEEDE